MKRILVVDDERGIRETFSIFLERAGHEVHLAESVKQARDILEELHVDAVVADIVLPGDAGLDLLAEVKRLRLRCPVVMITGQPTIENATEALRQGAFDFLVKPVKKDPLLRVVNKALEYKELVDGKRRLEEENARYRTRLEDLVAERTAQLTEANAQLRRVIDERLEAEKSLRQNKERLSLAMEISGAAEFETRPMEGRLICGKSMGELCGFSIQELRDMYADHVAMMEQVHPDDRARLLSSGLYQGAFDEVDITFRFLKRNDSWRTIRALARVVARGSRGLPERVVGLAMDITAQNQALELMRQQRDLGIALGSTDSLNRASELTLDYLMRREGLDSGVFYVINQYTGSLHIQCDRGLSEMVRKKISTLGSETMQYQSVMAGKPVYRDWAGLESRLGRKLNDDLLSMGMVPLKDKDHILGAVWVGSRSHSNIPEQDRLAVEAIASQVGGTVGRIRAQEAVRQGEARYRNLIETIPHGIIEMDLKGTILFCTEPVALRHGVRPDDLVGRSGMELMRSPLEANRLREFLQWISREEPGPTPYFTQVRHIRGHFVDIQVDWNYTRDDTRKVVSLTCVVTDITARKRAERALLQAHDELELRVRERTRELHAASEQLRRLAARQDEVLEMERKHIAREIHDEFGQNLTALNIGLSMLERLGLSEEALGRVERLKESAQRMLSTVQRITQRLRPTHLDDLGLAAALNWHVMEYQKYTGIRVHLHIDPEDPNTNSDQSIAVYRLVQEALTNVARHAEASKAEVSLVMKNEMLEVQVSDNGNGIDLETLETVDSFGIMGMRERVHSLGGVLDISPTPRKGTVVKARIPMVS